MRQVVQAHIATEPDKSAFVSIMSKLMRGFGTWSTLVSSARRARERIPKNKNITRRTVIGVAKTRNVGTAMLVVRSFCYSLAVHHDCLHLMICSAAIAENRVCALLPLSVVDGCVGRSVNRSISGSIIRAAVFGNSFHSRMQN